MADNLVRCQNCGILFKQKRNGKCCSNKCYMAFIRADRGGYLTNEQAYQKYQNEAENFEKELELADEPEIKKTNCKTENEKLTLVNENKSEYAELKPKHKKLLKRLNTNLQ